MVDNIVVIEQQDFQEVIVVTNDRYKEITINVTSGTLTIKHF